MHEKCVEIMNTFTSKKDHRVLELTLKIESLSCMRNELTSTFTSKKDHRVLELTLNPSTEPKAYTLKPY